MSRAFKKFQVNPEKASIAGLTKALNYVAISAIERIINEDEYMVNRFNNSKLPLEKIWLSFPERSLTILNLTVFPVSMTE